MFLRVDFSLAVLAQNRWQCWLLGEIGPLWGLFPVICDNDVIVTCGLNKDFG